SLAAELLAVAQFEILHFACKRPFRHENLRADIIDQARPANLILMKPSHSSCNARADDETGTRRSQHGADFTWRRARHSARGSCLKLRKKAQSVSLSRCCFRLKVSVTLCRPAILRVWSSERAAACGGQKGECPICSTLRVVRPSRRAAASLQRCWRLGALPAPPPATRSISPITSTCRPSTPTSDPPR